MQRMPQATAGQPAGSARPVSQIAQPLCWQLSSMMLLHHVGSKEHLLQTREVQHSSSVLDKIGSPL